MKISVWAVGRKTEYHSMLKSNAEGGMQSDESAAIQLERPRFHHSAFTNPTGF
jgi:hypothetical protein